MPETGAGPTVLGASGQVGWFLLNRLGPGAIGVARSTPSWSGRVQARWRHADLWQDEQACTSTRLISAGPLDGCVAWLERAGPGAIRRMVALSSMSVVHKAASPSARERDLAQRLLDSERRLQGFAQRHDIGCSIVRPTLIWGAGMDRSLTPVARHASGRGVVSVPSGALGLRSPVHADDLAALCIALADSLPSELPLAVGGAERLSLREVLTRVATSAGGRARSLPLPAMLLRGVGGLGARLGSDRAAAIARAVQDQSVDSAPVWHRHDLSPRGFDPAPQDWLPPT